MLDLLSSVPLGIAILIALFLYSTIGSAGIVYPVSPNVLHAEAWRHQLVRQWPAFEMTEFEWFHTPVFLGLCGLLVANIAITTIRRIPFRVVNLGVWMIHTGIITLVVGSVIYFGTKVEGDTPVVRREVVARVGDAEVRLPALVGAARTVGSGEAARTIRVAQVDPAWPILSGDDAGKKALSVSLVIERQSAEGKIPHRFVRQLLDGYPQYTEDVIPGRGRAVKLEEFGEKIVDADVELTLEASAQAWYWIKDSVALGVREARDDGEPTPWSQRIVKGLPRYNDWIASPGDVWTTVAGESSVRPLSIVVPAGKEPDALGNVSARITAFLRYAVMEERREPGPGEDVGLLDLIARDPSGAIAPERIVIPSPGIGTPALGGMVEVRGDQWMPDAKIDAATFASSLAIVITEPTDASVRIDPDAAARDGPIAIGDTGWKVHVREVVRNIDVGRDHPISLAILEVTTPEGETFARWAFPQGEMTRDMELDRSGSGDAHGEIQDRAVDPRITTVFTPGSSAPIVIAPASDGTVRMFRRGAGGYEEGTLAIGQPVTFGGGASLEVAAVSATSHGVTKPMIVPRGARDKDSDVERVFAMAQVELTKGAWSQRVWLPFNKYSFDDPQMAAAGLSRVEPVVVALPDGKQVELIFTRERRPLPDPVMLDDFVVTSTIGGFTGEMSSIRDWTSVIRFDDDDAQGWGPDMRVQTNEPAAHAGLRFFQAYWDAPQEGSAGMAFTGLGVGNRRGVVTQLAGCIIAVSGMIYAFYIKPIIKRRRRDRVMADLAARGIEPKHRGIPSREAEVGAAL